MDKTGLVLGKFYPPTRGHLYVIKYAEDRCPQGVIVVVGSLPSETIQSRLRCRWLRSMVGKKTLVLDIPDDSPGGQKVANITPADEDYWTTWRDNLNAHLPYKPETLFGSEEYIKTLAKYMEMKYEIADLDRKTVPISATMVRNDPKRYWDYIPDKVKPYYKNLLREQADKEKTKAKKKNAS